MRLTHRALAPFAAALLLPACADSPLQPHGTPVPTPVAAAAAISRDVVEYVVDFEGSHFSFACTADGEVTPDPEDGELVRMEGRLHVREVFTQDAAGNHHYTWHTMPVGLRGIGVTSGEEFRVTERSIGGANQTSQASTGHYRAVQRFVGLDTGRRFALVTTGHYVLDAGGQPIVTHDATTLECRP